MPPQVRNETLAQLLVDIAAATHEEANRNPYCGLLALKISMLVSDFLEERSENLVDLYMNKLHLDPASKFKVEKEGTSAGCAFTNEHDNPISMGVVANKSSVAISVVGPTSTVEHEWTAVEASILSTLIRQVQE